MYPVTLVPIDSIESISYKFLIVIKRFCCEFIQKVEDLIIRIVTESIIHRSGVTHFTEPKVFTRSIKNFFGEFV